MLTHFFGYIFLMKENKKRGFTLIELLVVVLIIGILAAVALPQYEKAVWKSRSAKLQIWAKHLLDAEQEFMAANGYYTRCLNLLSLDYQSTFPRVIRQEAVWENGNYIADCVQIAATENEEDGMILSAALLVARAVFSSGKYVSNGFGTSLSTEVAESQRRIGGLEHICGGAYFGEELGEHNEWKKLLKSWGFSKQTAQRYCYNIYTS